MTDVKQGVREFYDRVGWTKMEDTVYQNARYEDLRPVSHRYIHDCHMRVVHHIEPNGRFFLDAGSGPIQYPEYLEYSRGYEYRVCADISITALCEARERIGGHGLYVVADIANLPFEEKSFAGIVSLHTIHHLAENEQIRAYLELHRVLAVERNAVVVNGWSNSKILKFFEPLIKMANRLRNQAEKPDSPKWKSGESELGDRDILNRQDQSEENQPKGTFTSKHDYTWLKKHVATRISLKVFVWRTVSVRFLRALIHPKLGGRIILRVLYTLEELFPFFLGKYGKYPLIVIHRQQEID